MRCGGPAKASTKPPSTSGFEIVSQIDRRQGDGKGKGAIPSDYSLTLWRTMKERKGTVASRAQAKRGDIVSRASSAHM